MAHREVCPGPGRADWQDTGRTRMVGTGVKAGPGLYSLARDLYGGRVKEQRENDRFRRINAAFLAGDLPALLDAVDEPGVVPNGPMPPAIGPCLEYAVYHSPVPFIRALLEMGAQPNPEDHDGFPPLIAALTCSRSHPGSPARADVIEILELLLSYGADPNLRGHNDYTPLHMAVEERNVDAVRLLLNAGADPRLRTRIDDLETPRELAEKYDLKEALELLDSMRGR